MWITRKTYEDMVANNNNLKRINLSLMSEKNELYQENYKLAKELEDLKNKKTRKTTQKKEETKKTTTRKPKTKKEDK